MLCTTCSKDVSWIEIHYKSKHKFTLPHYLRENFDFDPKMMKDDHIYCEYCDTYVVWLQAHLKQYHNTDLSRYLKKHFTVKPDRQTALIYSIKRANREKENRERIKREAMARFKAGKQERTIQEYQIYLNSNRPKEAQRLFREIFKAWEPKISTHAFRNAHTLLSFSKEEAFLDLKQELCEAFYESLRSYDCTYGVAFSTYAYRCIQNKTQILQSVAETKRRKVIEYSDISVSQGSEGTNYSLTDLASCESGTLGKDYDQIEAKIMIEQVDLTNLERQVTTLLLNDVSRKEIGERLNLANFKVASTIKKIAQKMKERGITSGIC